MHPGGGGGGWARTISQCGVLGSAAVKRTVSPRQIIEAASTLLPLPRFDASRQAPSRAGARGISVRMEGAHRAARPE